MATQTEQPKQVEEPTAKVWTIEEVKAARAAFQKNADAAWARGTHLTASR